MAPAIKGRCQLLEPGRVDAIVIRQENGECHRHGVRKSCYETDSLEFCPLSWRVTVIAPAIIISPPTTVGSPITTSPVHNQPIIAPSTGSMSMAMETTIGDIHRSTVFTPVCPHSPGPNERYATHTTQIGSDQPNSESDGSMDDNEVPSRNTVANESHAPANRVTGKA